MHIIHENKFLSRGVGILPSNRGKGMAVDKKEIGKRIKKIRVIDLDMNQDAFAGKLAITQSTVSRYEKGEVIPPGDILLKIAKLGKTTMEKILEGEEG